MESPVAGLGEEQSAGHHLKDRQPMAGWVVAGACSVLVWVDGSGAGRAIKSPAQSLFLLSACNLCRGDS